MSEVREDNTAIFDAARKRSVLELAQRMVSLRRASGGILVGPCPRCGGEAKSARFKVDPRRNTWKCWAACGGGDAIALEQLLGGGNALDAAKRLAGDLPTPVRDSAPAASAADRRQQLENEEAERVAFARRIWDRAEPAAGSRKERSLVQTYLAARGFDLKHELVRHALSALRFAPKARMAPGLEAPAMVAAFRRREVQGSIVAWPVVGVHLTFLRRDGGGKAQARDEYGDALPAKKMFGVTRGAAMWLSAFDEPGPLVVCEGLETTLAAAVMASAARVSGMRIIAAGSLLNLAGEIHRDKWGRVDIDNPTPAPHAPAFTFPLDPSRDDVFIGVDRDMSEIKVRAKPAIGAPIGFAEDRILGAEARAFIAASMARQAWSDAGARNVIAMQPGPGEDFNDALVRRARRAA